MRTDFMKARSTKKDMTNSSTYNQKQVREHEYSMKIIELSHKICSDQTSRFYVTSSKGNKCIMMTHNRDYNAIIARVLKTKSVFEQLENMQKVRQFLSSRVIYPKINITDNECLQIVKDHTKNNKNMDLILVPPHEHRLNGAENAIDSYKCHFISGLATLNPDFPMHLWCRLLPLAYITLSLLRPFRVNPKISSEEFLNGVFDFKKNAYRSTWLQSLGL